MTIASLGMGAVGQLVETVAPVYSGSDSRPMVFNTGFLLLMHCLTSEVPGTRIGSPLPVPGQGVRGSGGRRSLPAEVQPPVRVSRQEKLFGKDFLLACLTTFSVGMGAHLLLPIVPLYVKGFGGSDADVGVILGIFPISALCARLLVGRVLDLWSRKWPLVAGGLLFFVLMPLYNVAASVPSILLLRLSQGFGFGIVSTATTVVAADVAPVRRRGEAMGYFGLAQPGSIAIAPGIALWLMGLPDLPLHGFPLVFFTCSVVAGILVLFALSIGETRRPAEGRPAASRGRGMSGFFSKNALPVTIAMGFASVALGAVMSFAPLYLSADGAGNVGVFFLVYASMMAVSRPIGGALSDRIDRNQLVAPLMVVCAAGLGILSLSPSLSVVIVAATVFGLGVGSLNSTLLALAVDVVKPQERGAALAMFQSSLDLGIATGSMVLGLVAQAAGYPALFLTAAGFDLLGLVYFLAYRRWWASRRVSAVG